MSLVDKIKEEGEKITSSVKITDPITGKVETYDYDTRYVLSLGDSLVMYRPSTSTITKLPNNVVISFER